MNNLAPILLFVYDRLEHTKRTIDALKKNKLSNESNLIIYSDGAKNKSSAAQVKAVRQFIKNIDGFRTVELVERQDNWGLAANIIDGVTRVVTIYEKVIVLEDDIVTSPAFLSFMNQALELYKGHRDVWHVSGWNYPLKDVQEFDAYFWRAMNCWGWGTWSDKWIHFKKDPENLINKMSSKDKYNFDLDGSGIFWPQVISNANGKINTWAIFWYATIYQNHGVCLNPFQSYVDNIGHDGTGVHCGKVDEKKIIKVNLNVKTNLKWPVEVTESDSAVKLIKRYYKKQKKIVIIRILNKISRLLLGKNIVQ